MQNSNEMWLRLTSKIESFCYLAYAYIKQGKLEPKALK